MFAMLGKNKRSLETSVSIATGYGLDGRGSILGREKRFFSVLQRSGCLWGPHGLL
jgi:hypothetical protein